MTVIETQTVIPVPVIGPMNLSLRRLTELMLNDEEYDEEFVRPTRQAFDLAWRTISEAMEISRREAPPASPAAVGDGGIFIQWGDAGRCVCLLVPADPAAAYLYCRAPDYRKTLREVSGAGLASCLDWLAGG